MEVALTSIITFLVAVTFVLSGLQVGNPAILVTKASTNPPR